MIENNFRIVYSILGRRSGELEIVYRSCLKD